MIKIVSFFWLLLLSLSVNSDTLIIVGDSLSAGYQMPVEKSWAAMLSKQLAQHGKKIQVINASISGDTTGNGLARLPELLTQQPDYVLIALGANDGLRGFSPNIINNNLKVMIDNIKTHNAQPILMQIQVPPNYGKRYSQSFRSIYTKLSEQENIPLIPFYLEQVIVKDDWMMDDGLHPNSTAQPWIAEFMAESLATIIN